MASRNETENDIASMDGVALLERRPIAPISALCEADGIVFYGKLCDKVADDKEIKGDGIYQIAMPRRMFSQEIVESDAFLDMPSSSQALYFHLGMYADDDGFVNPKKIMRLMGAAEDDLNVLLTKRFVLSFGIGVIVIKHWRINNLLRKDWYRPTKYIEEMKQLKVKENGSYTELGNETLTIRSRSIGKVSIGKVNKVIKPSGDETPQGKEIADIIFLFKTVNPSIDKYYKNKTQRDACARLLKIYGRENLEKMIAMLPEINARPYWPKSVTPAQLDNNIPLYKARSDEEKNKGSSTKIIKIF